MKVVNTLVAAVCLGLSVDVVNAFPQQTTYSNATSATKTSSLSGTKITPAASLTTSCHLYYPGDIALNSWYTEHANLTVATIITNYIQYNNTKIALNTTTIQGVAIQYTAESGNLTTGFAPNLIAETAGLGYSGHYTIAGIPSDLIADIPSTSGFMYARSVFLTDTAVTKTYTQRGDKVSIFASPTPFVEPDMVQMFLDYYDGTNMVSSTVVQVYNQSGELGGAWPTSVDWPCQVTFNTVPTQFLDWMMEFPGVSSKYPVLSECTQWTSLPITGAPTVHIVVSTLTHETGSVVSTVNGNHGSVMTTGSLTSERTFSTSKETTSSVSKETSLESSSASKQASSVVSSVHSDDVSVTGSTATSSGSTQTSSIISSVNGDDGSATKPTSETSASKQISSVISSIISSANGDDGSAKTSTSKSSTQEITTPLTTQVTSNTILIILPSKTTSDVVEESPGVHLPVSTTTTPESKASSAAYPTVHLPVPETTTSKNVAPKMETIATHQIVPTVNQPQSQKAPESEAHQTDQGNSGAGSSSEGEGSKQVATKTNVNGQTRPLNHETVAPSSGFTIGSSVVTPNSESAFVYESQTLSAGGPVVTADGYVYSIATSASEIYLVRGDATSAPAISVIYSSAATPAITVGSKIITADSASNYVIGEQTLAPGNPAITTEGTTYSLAASGSALIVNGVTTPISEAGASQTAAYVVAGQTLSQGSGVEVSGTTYSLAPSATAIIVNGVTSALPQTVGSGAVFFGSAVATSLSNGYVIGSQTLTSDAEITVSGTTYSLASSGGAVMVNGQTQHPAASAAAKAPTAYVIGSTTLTPGDAVTVSDTTYSMPSTFPASPVLVVNGVTTEIPAAQIFTVGDETYTAIPAANSGMVIDSQTLSPGSKITVNGEQGKQTLSLASDGAVETIGAGGLGTVIMSGLQGAEQTSASATSSGSVKSSRSTSIGVKSLATSGQHTSSATSETSASSVSSAGAAKQTGGVVFAMAAVLGAVVLH